VHRALHVVTFERIAFCQTDLHHSCLLTRGAGMAGKRWFDMMRMSHGEYRANLTGLNIFFGAVLGFVMAGTESLGAQQFALMLAVVSGMVVGILYISSSKRRLAYAALAALMIFMLPDVIEAIVGKGSAMPDKLQPTLAVWAVMTMLVEFLPRERIAAEPAADVADSG
jgi:hypothetical protein